MSPKIDHKSIKKGGQHGKASWHRFLIDFGGFGVPSWGRKSTKNRSKKASKNDEKMKRNKMAKKSQQDAPTTRDTSGLGPWGGLPLIVWHPPPAQKVPSSSLSAKVLSCLVFVLSCLVQSCLVLSWLDFPSQLASKNPPKSIKNRCQDAFPS